MVVLPLVAHAVAVGVGGEGIGAQREFLLGLGVAIGQGFLFAPGLAPAEVQARYLP